MLNVLGQVPGEWAGPVPAQRWSGWKTPKGEAQLTLREFGLPLHTHQGLSLPDPSQPPNLLGDLEGGDFLSSKKTKRHYKKNHSEGVMFFPGPRIPAPISFTVENLPYCPLACPSGCFLMKASSEGQFSGGQNGRDQASGMVSGVWKAGGSDGPPPQGIIFLLWRENSKAWAQSRPGDKAVHFMTS